MLRRSLKVLFVIFAALAMLEALGFPVNSLIAGLGLGGLTVSLAAKDTASNLFSGLVLLVERPFVIGDWVTCAGVEGTVEDITFRSTKIRTLANTLTVIPNSLVSAGFITNSSQRKMRLSEFTLGVCYDTPRAAIERVMADLRGDADLRRGSAARHSGGAADRFFGEQHRYLCALFIPRPPITVPISPSASGSISTSSI